MFVSSQERVTGEVRLLLRLTEVSRPEVSRPEGARGGNYRPRDRSCDAGPAMRQVNGNGQARAAAESLAVRVLARVSELTNVLVRTIEDQNPGYRTVGVVPPWARSVHSSMRWAPPSASPS